MELRELGWDSFFESSFSTLTRNHESVVPARVVAEHREIYRLAAARGELSAELLGKLRYQAETREDLPVTGDWVAAQEFPGEAKGIIHAVLPRRTRLARKAAGERTEVQLVAANVDTLFVVTSLNADFNPRRLERYVAFALESGVAPVIVLTKADLVPDPSPFVREVGLVAPGRAVHVISARTGAGLDALREHLVPGRTVAFVGSSGVGKTTLVNLFEGGTRAVREVRDGDDRGRHATTARELVVLPGGGLLLDTPGMRELTPWEGGEALSGTFSEIDALANGCRFRDCRHQGEPGCAVAGAVPPDRLASHAKLRRETERLAELRSSSASLVEKRRWKNLMASARETDLGKRSR